MEEVSRDGQGETGTNSETDGQGVQEEVGEEGMDVQGGKVREEEGEGMDVQGVKGSEEEGEGKSRTKEECVTSLCLLQWDVCCVQEDQQQRQS